VSARSPTTLRWLVPTLAYIVVAGALGVTSKLALRSLVWQDLILWVAVGYVSLAVIFVVRGVARPFGGPATPWAALAAGLAISGVIALYLALGSGDASKVVPVSAAYPAVTLLLSALMLGERLSAARIGGMVLVVAGVVVLTVA
jgi:transporter family protein